MIKEAPKPNKFCPVTNDLCRGSGCMFWHNTFIYEDAANNQEWGGKCLFIIFLESLAEFHAMKTAHMK